MPGNLIVTIHAHHTQCLQQTSGIGHISEIHLWPGAMFEMGSINSRINVWLIISHCDSRFELVTSGSPQSATLKLTAFTSVDPNDQVWPVVEAMPMGWSWALHICTDALEHAVRITVTGRDPAREKCAAPPMTAAEPVCSCAWDFLGELQPSP